jgi:hypothetical protein
MDNQKEKTKEFIKTEMIKNLFSMFGGENMSKKDEEVFSKLCSLPCDDLMYNMKKIVDNLKGEGIW